MKKICYYLLMTTLFLLSLACQKNVGEENMVKVNGELLTTKTERGIKVKTEEMLSAAKILIKGEISLSDIDISDEYLSIIQENNNEIEINLAFLNEKVDIVEFGIKRTDIMLELKLLEKVDIQTKINKKESKLTDEEILLGDYNLDKEVGLSDFNALKSNFGKVSDKYDIAPANKGKEKWENIYCVLNGDGIVGLYDLAVFASNFGKKEPSVSPKEPSVEKIEISGKGTLDEGETEIMTAKVVYDDGSEDNTGVIWGSEDPTVVGISNTGVLTAKQAGEVNIYAEKDGIKATKLLTVNELIVENGIALYVQEGVADAIHAWVRNGVDTPVFSAVWPGAKFQDILGEETDEYKVTKKNDVYKILFKDKDAVWYILTKSGGKLFDDSEMTEDTYYTADGEKHTENPFDYSPYVKISPTGGEQKGEKVVTITISGDGITDRNIKFNSENITITGENTEILLSDYLDQGETGEIVVSAKNSEGTKIVTEEFTRNDNKIIEAIDVYGTLDPFVEHAVYFVMTDRFVNGDTSNDYREQGKENGEGTWDRAIGSANIGYLGGDFKGIYENADYIKSMGFGAVWLTPIVDNPDEAFTGGTPCNEGASPGSDGGKTGYHGYWADNFYQVDEHLPSDGLDFKEYTDKMRDKGLKTVLDIVLNHANPSYSMEESQYDRSKFGKLYNENWEVVADTGNQQNGHEWFNGNDQLAQLADFNVKSEEVFQYLSEAQLKWIREGADAFRIDTIKHMPKSWWKRFVDKMREEKPGMYMFGEHFDVSSNEMGAYQNETGMDTLDFPCKYAMQNVFGGDGGYDGLLGYLHLDSGVMNPYTAATFYDNHDMSRMNATDEGFIDAHNWLFTTRGLPVVYYGSEMGFQRGKGEHSGNRNYYGTENIELAKSHKIYKELVKIGKIRKENIALQKGIQINIDISGLQATFLRVYQYKGINQTALVMLNKGDSVASFSIRDYITAGEWEDAKTGELINVNNVVETKVNAHSFKILLLNAPIENDELIDKCKSLTK